MVVMMMVMMMMFYHKIFHELILFQCIRQHGSQQFQSKPIGIHYESTCLLTVAISALV